MPATIRDVAAEAGVSVATVSRVASGGDYPIGAETKAKVLAAIEKLNYRPNGIAKGLTQRNSRLVGVVAPDMSNPYYPEVTRGIEDVAGAKGYQVLSCSTDRDPARVATLGARSRDRRLSSSRAAQDSGARERERRGRRRERIRHPAGQERRVQRAREHRPAGLPAHARAPVQRR